MANSLTKAYKRFSERYFPHLSIYILYWYIFGKKKIRKHSIEEYNYSMSIYKRLFNITWEDTKQNYRDYFNRLSFIIENSEGNILEVGCGCGNVTKWLSVNEKVTSILALDTNEECIDFLRKANLLKVKPTLGLLEGLNLPTNVSFDTIVISEVIEHIYPDQENSFLKELRKYIKVNTKFIITTPIGWLEDPTHIRGFSKKQLINHVQKKYGSILKIDYTAGYSQSILGIFKF